MRGRAFTIKATERGPFVESGFTIRKHMSEGEIEYLVRGAIRANREGAHVVIRKHWSLEGLAARLREIGANVIEVSVS